MMRRLSNVYIFRLRAACFVPCPSSCVIEYNGGVGVPNLGCARHSRGSIFECAFSVVIGAR